MSLAPHDEATVHTAREVDVAIAELGRKYVRGGVLPRDGSQEPPDRGRAD